MIAREERVAGMPGGRSPNRGRLAVGFNGHAVQGVAGCAAIDLRGVGCFVLVQLDAAEQAAMLMHGVLFKGGSAGQGTFR